MYTTENYSKEFWNSMKSKHSHDSIPMTAFSTKARTT